MLRFLLIVLPILLYATIAGSVGCAGPSSGSIDSGGEARPARISFRDYRTDLHLVLVNESHTDRIEQYSTKRQDASTKVASDEVMAALLDFLGQSGFEEITEQGAAPISSQQATQSIQVESGGRSRFLLAQKGMPADRGNVFRSSATAIWETYNAIYQLQSVETRPSDELFKQPEPPQGRN